MVAGEVRTSGWVDIPKVVRQTINGIGFTSSEQGFDGSTCGVMVAIEGQSQDIAVGVDEAANKEQGAGDQGLMFGYACDETPELMPMPIAFAHRLTRRLAEARKDGTLPWARPDGKSQVTIAYENGKPARVDTVVLSTQHNPDVTHAQIRDGIINEVIQKSLPGNFLTSITIYRKSNRNIRGGWPHGRCWDYGP